MTKAHSNSLKWIHPSWRDVVIEHLAEHPSDRARFLKCCDIEGFELALSVSGGADGARRQPLLQNEDDWAALERRAGTLVRSCKLGGQRRVLSAVRTLMDDEAPAARHRLRSRLAYAVLSGLVERWDGGRATLNVDVLELFYFTSELVTPLCGGPQLQRTLKGQLKVLELLEEVGPSELRLDDALRVINVVERNEPRALRQQHYPTCLRDFATLLGEQLLRTYEMAEGLRADDFEALQSSDEAELEELSWELFRWVEIVTRLPSGIASQFERPVDLVHCLEEVATEVGRFHEEHRQGTEDATQAVGYRDDEDESREDDEDMPFAAELDVRQFSVAALFADL